MHENVTNPSIAPCRVRRACFPSTTSEASRASATRRERRFCGASSLPSTGLLTCSVGRRVSCLITLCAVTCSHQRNQRHRSTFAPFRKGQMTISQRIRSHDSRFSMQAHYRLSYRAVTFSLYFNIKLFYE